MSNDASHRLRQKGYSAAGWENRGQSEYALYRWNEDNTYEMVSKFDSAEALNNMVKLLIEEGD